MAEFCHLHNHTEFSLLDGACRTEKMVELAREMGMTAVAMTDHGNLFGAVNFYNTVRAGGLKPIIGYEGYLTPYSRNDRSQGGSQGGLYHLTLLARNGRGLRNLLKLSSLAYTQGLYYKPRMDRELLEECSDGLICLSGCAKSRLNHFVLNGRVDEARQWLEEMRSVFGRDYFFIEVQDHGLEEQKQTLPRVFDLAGEMGIPTAATNDSHYLHSGDKTWHEVLLCISTKSTLDDPDRFKFDCDQLYFKSPAEMANLFPDHPQALENTLRIAEMCDVELDESLKFPAFEQDRCRDNAQYLRRLVREGLEQRYDGVDPQMQRRCEYELDVIERMGYADYFLITWDFIRFAREQEIPHGMRGSGSSSLVAHALGLTDINPMDYDLIFNRFLDPERREQPDIDIDLCERRREDVIDYVRRRYGQNSTAQIITFGTLMARNCVRDVGRVMGVPLEKVDRLAKMIPAGPGVTIKDGLESAPELGQLAQGDEEVARLLEHARKLEGLPRHASTHAAGVVIADKALWELVPLYKSGDGAVMTQWAMGDLEKMGMLKMDFLGLRTLTIIDRTLDIIQRNGKQAPNMDSDALDLKDEETYRLLTEGRTAGIFQLGSDGMKRLLVKLKPNSIEDLIAIVALYRPGPWQSGMVDDFIRRKHGEAKIEYPHPTFEPILKPTYGVIVYQEQIMRMCHEIAGISMAEALSMIKAISKKKEEIIGESRERFIQGAVKNGVGNDTAVRIFDLIMHFAGYGFNKAHASAYAFVAYRTAFLKAHFPTEFMAASISCEMGDTDKAVKLMEDCRSMGIEVLPPDINESGLDFTVVEDHLIRFGFGAIKNVGTGAALQVIKERQANGPYTSLFDFCERVDTREVTKGATDALMKAGCFDELPGRRAQLLAVLETALKAGSKARRDREMGQTGLFGPQVTEDPEERVRKNLPDVPPLSPMELARQESEALGLYVRHDPLQEHRRALERMTSASGGDLEHMQDGDGVVIGGIVEKVRKKRLKDKRQMGVLSVLDTEGMLECVMWPETLEKYAGLLEKNVVLLFAGKVSHRQDTSVIVDAAFPITAAAELVDTMVISVSCETVNGRIWEELDEIIAGSKGRTPVVFELKAGGLVLQCRKGKGRGVKASESLARRIEERTGEDSVHFRVRPPAANGRNGRNNSRRRRRRK